MGVILDILSAIVEILSYILGILIDIWFHHIWHTVRTPKP
jgi:hypothetical protein